MAISQFGMRAQHTVPVRITHGSPSMREASYNYSRKQNCILRLLQFVAKGVTCYAFCASICRSCGFYGKVRWRALKCCHLRAIEENRTPSRRLAAATVGFSFPSRDFFSSVRKEICELHNCAYFRSFMGTYARRAATLSYAGRMILPALTSSSMRCALQPEMRAIAKMGVNSSTGIFSIV